MTSELVVLARLLSELNGTSLDTLEGRIVFQKRVYLLQATGIDLGYRFDWDVRGPYSRGLALDGARYYADKAYIDDLATQVDLAEGPARVVSLLKPLVARPSQDTQDEVDWLELICSLHFIHKTLDIPLSDDRRLVQRLHDLKPRLTSPSVAVTTAVERLVAIEELSAESEQPQERDCN